MKSTEPKSDSLNTTTHKGSDTGEHGILHYLAPGLWQQSGRLNLACLTLLGGVLLRIAEPWPLQYIVDHILLPMTQLSPEQLQQYQQGYGPLVVCVGLLVLIAVARAICDYWTTIMFSLLGNHVVSDLRAKVYEHLQSLSLSFHQRSRSGDLTLRLVSDMNMLKDVAVTAALPLLSSVVLLVGMFAYMIYLNWRLGLMVAAAVPTFYLIAFRKAKKIHHAASQQRQREGKLAATAAESIAAVKTVQAHAAQAGFSRAFTSQNKKSLKEGVKTGRLTAGLERSVDVMIAVTSALVLWQGTRYVFEGSLTAGGLIVYLTYLKRGFKPLQSFAKYTGRLSKAMAAGGRITELLTQQPAVNDLPGAPAAPQLQGSIQLRNVSFAYPDGKAVLQNVSLSIQAGKRVAIVGPSGIGKSTLLGLMLRLYEPDSGAVLLDAQDIRNWQINSVRQQLGVVLQENVLFAGTIRDNITLGHDDCSEAEILAAVQTAGCDDFIFDLPDQLNSVVGERGTNLSQGQRQRIVLARSVLRRNPILLLDEPTSNLDPQSKNRVLKAIKNVSAGRTTLMVTHEIPLALEMDQIMFITSQRILFGDVQQVATDAEFRQFAGLSLESKQEVCHVV